VDAVEKGRTAKVETLRATAKEQEEPQEKAPKNYCEPSSLGDSVLAVAKKIREARGRPLFILAGHSIEDPMLDRVYQWKQQLRSASKGNDPDSADVDVLIHSPGGNLNACFRVARLLCQCVNAWEALVPGQATSGATLICLGSCNIVMSQLGRLGPLDPQVISRNRQKFFAVERQSPLEAFEALRVLREFSLTSLDAAMKFLLDSGVAPHLALDTAATIAIRSIEPILGKVEPYDLGAFALDSKVALAYCRSVGQPLNASKSTQRNVDPQKLVEGYPAHEFEIDLEEARALNFAVCEPTPEIEALFDEVRPYLEDVHEFVGFLA
jgi:Serine dehydrogenase proteinase